MKKNSRGEEMCPHCGAKMVAYWHRLNKPLVMALFELYKVEEANIAQIGLTHNQICNFQKLKYWGFIRKVLEEEGGTWRIIEDGIRFVEKQIPVLIRVKTYRQDVVGAGGELLFIDQIVDEEWDTIRDYIKTQEPYVKKAGQLELFRACHEI